MLWRGWGRRRGPGCVLAWVLSRILRPLARQRQISVAAEIDATFPLSTWPVALWELWWRSSPAERARGIEEASLFVDNLIV